MKYLYLHLAVFLTLLFLICAGLLVARQLEGLRAKQQLREISDTRDRPFSAAVSNSLPQPDSVLPAVFVTQTGPGTESSTAAAPVYTPEDILPRYQELYQQNADMAGWLELPGTYLDLPVMYTPRDPQHYLYRLFDGTPSSYGTPFADARCSISPRSDNIILHGHHMRDGTMFSALTQYADPSFFRQHPVLHFDTLYEEGQYEVIAAFSSVYDETADTPDLYYNFIDAKDEADFNRFVSQIKKASAYDTGKTATYGDQLITLITCDFQSTNGRFNVIARKLDTQSEANQ